MQVVFCASSPLSAALLLMLQRTFCSIFVGQLHIMFEIAQKCLILKAIHNFFSPTKNWQIFLVKSKLSTSKLKTATFSRIFLVKSKLSTSKQKTATFSLSRIFLLKLKLSTFIRRDFLCNFNTLWIKPMITIIHLTSSIQSKNFWKSFILLALEFPTFFAVVACNGLLLAFS